MIRINLLAQRKRAVRQEGSQLWLGLVLGLVVLEIAALFVYHGMRSEELADKERKNRELTAQIDQSKKAIAKHTEVKEKVALLRAREEAIEKLQSARSGPAAVLLELSRMLTPGRGPSVSPEHLSQIRRDNPLAAFNQNWDARRLWLLSFKEEKRKVRIEGLARDGEDVSELARRMGLSAYFGNVRLLPAKREVDPKTKLETVRFSLEAEVKY
ncbi:MAG TPA: PilN domain-containing protein [Polyangiaceae bacterium]